MENLTDVQKANRIYEKKGADGVYDAVNDGFIRCESWNFCIPCDTETPILRDECLCCGTPNDINLNKC